MSSSRVLCLLIFSENHGGYGGGMCNYNSSPTIIDCVFFHNAALGDCKYGCSGRSGGMCNIDSSPIAITPDAPLTNTPPPQHKQADHEGNSLLQVMKSHPNVKKTSLPPAYFVPYSSQEPVLTIYILHANRASV